MLICKKCGEVNSLVVDIGISIVVCAECGTEYEVRITQIGVSKICKICKKDKKIEEFDKAPKCKDGHRNQCIMCRRKLRDEKKYVKFNEVMGGIRK